MSRLIPVQRVSTTHGYGTLLGEGDPGKLRVTISDQYGVGPSPGGSPVIEQVPIDDVRPLSLFERLLAR